MARQDVTTQPSILRDDRGGSQFVAYLILIVGIAFVALAGVRAFTDSTFGSFDKSTKRFGEPGTYAGSSSASSDGL